MVISFYMKGNNKSTKYELVESLAPSSKIPKADSMDGTIGDIFNKEVNDSNHSRCVHVKLLFQFQFMNPHGFGCLHIGYRAVLKFELLKVQ